MENITKENGNLNKTINNLNSENQSLKEFKSKAEEKIPGLTKDENNKTIVIEKNNNLTTVMTDFVKTSALTGYNKYKVSENFTNYLGAEVKKKFKGNWTCISGYQFYNYYNSVKYFIRFTIGQMSLALFGSG